MGDETSLVTILTAAISSLGGAITAGGVIRWAIGRTLKENDKKHESAEKRTQENEKTLKEMAKDLSNMSTAIAVMSASSNKIDLLDKQLDANQEKFIQVTAWTEQHKKDLDAMFDKTRALETRVDSINNIVATCKGNKA